LDEQERSFYFVEEKDGRILDVAFPELPRAGVYVFILGNLDEQN